MDDVYKPISGEVEVEVEGVGDDVDDDVDDLYRPISQAVEVEVEGIVAGEHQIAKRGYPPVVEIHVVKKVRLFL